MCIFAKKNVLHRILAYILLFSLHIQPLYIVSIGIDFVVNNEYIREMLCINKEQPELSCGGTCYLMKQINDSEPNQNDSNSILTKIIKLEYVFFDFSESNADYSDIIFKKLHTLQITSNYTSPHFDIFHPPQVS